MNKIEVDEEEYDEEGNVIPQGPLVSAKELQNMGMPVHRPTRQVNGDTNGGGTMKPPPPNLPPNLHGNPEQYNPVIRLQNIPVSSLPSGSNRTVDPHAARAAAAVKASVAADPHEAPAEGGGGYLDPETGDWVPEKLSSSKKQTVTPLKHNKDRSQDSSKVPSLKINLGPRETQNHGFFAELDKNDREREGRRSGRSTSSRAAANSNSTSNSNSSKSKKKKKSSKKKYRSESEESSEQSDSDIEYID